MQSVVARNKGLELCDEAIFPWFGDKIASSDALLAMTKTNKKTPPKFPRAGKGLRLNITYYGSELLRRQTCQSE